MPDQGVSGEKIRAGPAGLLKLITPPAPFLIERETLVFWERKLVRIQISNLLDEITGTVALGATLLKKSV